MTARKARRVVEKNRTKLKSGAKTQLAIMIISVVLMVFSVTQVYYLTKYTLGYDVPYEKLKVYRWVCMLLDGSQNTTTQD